MHYHANPFGPGSFNPQTDLPGAVLVSQMWWYASTVFYPTQFLKSMGLYVKNEIGQYPAVMPKKGQGKHFSVRYKKPVFLNEKPRDYNLVEEFDRISEIYEYCVKPFSKPIFEETVKLMTPLIAPDSRILDTSCGPGTELLQLIDLVPQGEIVGMDLSAEMVATAHESAKRQGFLNTAFFQADVAKMPRHFQGKFDATYCSLAFHHYPDPQGAVNEMYRVLNKGGHAFVADPGPKWYNLISAPIAKWADPGWIGFHTGEEFRERFLKAGFSDFYWNEILPGIGLSIATK